MSTARSPRSFQAERAQLVTYLGIPARIWVYRITGGAMGRRVRATQWLADSPTAKTRAGDIELVDMTGDGRRGAGTRGGPTVHARITLPAGTEPQAHEWALARLHVDVTQ